MLGRGGQGKEGSLGLPRSLVLCVLALGSISNPGGAAGAPGSLLWVGAAVARANLVPLLFWGTC